MRGSSIWFIITIVHSRIRVVKYHLRTSLYHFLPMLQNIKRYRVLNSKSWVAERGGFSKLLRPQEPVSSGTRRRALIQSNHHKAGVCGQSVLFKAGTNGFLLTRPHHVGFRTVELSSRAFIDYGQQSTTTFLIPTSDTDNDWSLMPSLSEKISSWKVCHPCLNRGHKYWTVPTGYLVRSK